MRKAPFSTHWPSVTPSRSILPLTSALMSTLVFGWIFPVALTFWTIFWRSAFAVCTVVGLVARARTTAAPATARTTTAPPTIHQIRFFISQPPEPEWARVYAESPGRMAKLRRERQQGFRTRHGGQGRGRWPRARGIG